MDQHTNFAISTVATAPSPASSGDILTVAGGEGAWFPAAPFTVVVWPVADAFPTPTTAEVVRVTAKSTDTFTISRTQEGSTARSISAGDRVMLAITKGLLQGVEQAISDVAADLAAAQGLAPGNTLSGDGPPDDSLGNDGDFYIQIDSDPPVIYGPKTAGAWGGPIIIGGGAMLSGNGVPDESLGTAGDFYVDLSSNPTAMYGPKGATWGLPIDLGAPTGAGGPAGGVLAGTYPNPVFASDIATQAELDAVEAEIGDISGVVVLGGLTPPGGGDGLDGAWWFDTVTGKLYGPKTGGVWDIENPLLLGGIAVTTGALSPTADIGGEGDIFIKTSDSTMYVKDDVDWGVAIPLQGPQGDAGINLVNRGVWSSVTAYAVDDLITRGGSAWQAIATSTNHDPVTDDGTRWRVFAQKGATGAVGAGFVEGLMIPIASNCPAPTSTAGPANSANTARFTAMNPVPFTGVLDSMAVYNQTSVGNFKLLVYDTGDSTPGSYTLLYASSGVAMSVAGDWQTITGVGLDVTSGQRLIFAAVPDVSGGAWGRAASLVSNNSGVLPVEFAPASTRVKMTATKGGLTYASPATSLTEANMAPTNIVTQIIGQVVGA